jgi:transcriptional regulator with XRE-family HTH domain
VEPAAVRLKRLRQSAQPTLSQRVLADEIGMAASTYARYEDPNDFKKQNLSLDLAKRLVAPFGKRGIPAGEVLALAGLDPEDASFDSARAQGEDLRSERLRLGWSAAELAQRVVAIAEMHGDELTLSQQAVAHFEGGKTKGVPRWIRYAREALESRTPDKSDTVAITEIDLEYGMGGTFADGLVEVQVHDVPRRWAELITPSPSGDLTLARGRGDSMEPTIHHGDMVIIDRAQRTIREPDMIWALTVGDMAMIKRLRVRGETVQILSDNPRVPPDQAHAEEVHLVGRVVFIGRRT